MPNTERQGLIQRLERYPVERYPVQHATTQFHLGSLLLHTGDTEDALQALDAAVRVFEGAGMRLEQGKATLMLGVALRSADRPDEAAAAFIRAGDVLAGLDQPAEQAAAAYNLALVQRATGDVEGAHESWRRARELFLRAGYPAQAGAAARDHGGSLMLASDVQAAVPLLEQAVSLAEDADDQPGLGAAANALGLAQLAAGDPASAVRALRRALGALPRTVRPADYAMVKANLALAHEHSGEWARARLAARQALAQPSAAAPVRSQAQQLLTRRPGPPAEDLLAVLDEEHRDDWLAVLREEVLRAADAPAEQRHELVFGFLDGVLNRPEVAYALAQTLLQVVLEQPPRTYDVLIAAIVDACADRPDQDRDRLHAVVSSAMARFAMPQWQRLVASLNAAAQSAGHETAWT